MLPNKNFRNYISWVFGSFVGILCLIYSLIIYFAIEKTETHLIDSYLIAEHDRLQQLYQQSTDSQRLLAQHNVLAWIEQTQHILPNGISIESNAPGVKSTYAHLSHGLHEISNDSIHILSRPLTPDIDNLILVLNENQISRIDNFESLLSSLFIILSITLIILGIIIALYLAKKVAAPIIGLNQHLQQENPETPLAESSRQDEIGELARTFSSLIARLKSFLQREQQFTRHASHELRTPVGVILNSLSVMKIDGITDEKKQRNLDRIEQSAVKMNQLIETFLVLGREPSNSHIQQNSINIASLIQASVDQFKRDDTHSTLHLDPDLLIHSNVNLVAVLLDNAIKNAFSYCNREVNILQTNNRIEIRNDFMNQAQAPSGYGFGQEIIQRIANHLGWHVVSTASETAFTLHITLDNQGRPISSPKPQ